jgi:hypothetical protein
LVLGCGWHRYLKEVQAYIAQQWPYWDRKGGADHLMVLTDDHGACDEFGANLRVAEIENAVFLTHFGYRGGCVLLPAPLPLERGTTPKRSRRARSPRFGLQSCRGKSAGVVKRLVRSPTRNP